MIMFHDALLKTENYTLFRRDRVGVQGGGVLMLVHNSLKAMSCQKVHHDESSETVWRSVKLGLQETLLVGICYRPPNS